MAVSGELFIHFDSYMAGESTAVSSNPRPDAFSGLRSVSSCPVRAGLRSGSLEEDVRRRRRVVEQLPQPKLLVNYEVSHPSCLDPLTCPQAVALTEAESMSCTHLLGQDARILMEVDLVQAALVPLDWDGSQQVLAEEQEKLAQGLSG